MTFNLDGEPLSGKTFRMELLPAALAGPLLPDLPAATLDQASQSKDARPAGIQQPGSLIEPLNVKRKTATWVAAGKNLGRIYRSKHRAYINRRYPINHKKT